MDFDNQDVAEIAFLNDCITKAILAFRDLTMETRNEKTGVITQYRVKLTDFGLNTYSGNLKAELKFVCGKEERFPDAIATEPITQES